MEDSEILSKRRKLDMSGGESSGHNGKNTSPLSKDSNVQETKTCQNEASQNKEIKWNFKLVRPEVLKRYRRIVDGLDCTVPLSNRSSENETLQLPQNGLTPSKEEKKESAFAPKRKLNQDHVIKQNVDKETISAAFVLPKNCPALMTVSHENTGSNSRESNNGCTNTRQHSSELSIPRPLTKDDVRHEIRTLIREHAREAIDKVASLKSRVSKLESENRCLKHRVKMLYKALKEALVKEKPKKVIPAILTTTTVQSKPPVKPKESVCLESRLSTKPQSIASIKDGAFQAFQKINDSPRSGSEAGDKTRQKGTSPPAVVSRSKVRVQRNTMSPSVEHRIIKNQNAISSVGTSLLGPITSLSKETTPTSIHLPNHFPTLSKPSAQDAFVPTTGKALNYGTYSSVVTSQHNVANLSSNVNTTQPTPNPVSLLYKVLNEILPNSTTEMPDQFTSLNQLSGLETPKVSNNFQVPLPSTATGISFPGTTPNRSEEVFRKQSSPPLKRKISTSMLNSTNEKASRRDKDRLSNQHNAEFLSPMTPDRGPSKTESKQRELFGNDCNVEINGRKGTSPPINCETTLFKSSTDTPFSDSQVQSKVALSVASSSPVNVISSSPLKQKIPTSVLNAHNEKTSQWDKKRLLDQDNAELLSPIAPDRKPSKTESKQKELLGNTFHVEMNGQKRTSPPINDGTSHYKSSTDTPFSDSQVQSVLSAASSSPSSFISQPAQMVHVTSSGCPSLLGNSISITGQSVGLLNGISMLAQAAGLGNTTTTEPILCPVKSSTSQTPPLDRTIPNETIKIHKPDLTQQSLHAVYKDNSPPQITQCTSEPSSSQFQAHHLPRSFIPVPEPQQHKVIYRQHLSTNGSIKSNRTNMFSRHVDEHQSSLTVDEKKSDTTIFLKPHRNVNNPALQNKERPIYNSLLATRSFSKSDPCLAAVSPNKFQMMPYRAKPEESHTLLSLPRFYNDREYQEHTTRQTQSSTWSANYVLAKPRYLPYPTIGANVQQIPVIPARSTIQYIPKMNERLSPKSRGASQPTLPLNAGAQSFQCSLLPRRPQIEEKSAVKSSNEELLFQPPRFSCSPETSSSKARLTAPGSARTNTSSLTYDKEGLLLQLLQSGRAPCISHYSSTTYRNGPSRVTQDVQTTNAVKLRSRSSETSKRYVYLQPQNHVQNNTRNPKESSICNGGKTHTESVALPGKPSSVGESHNEVGCWQTPVRSLNSASFHTNGALNPQIELSFSCQQYLTQLRKSPEARPFGHQNSIYSTARLPSQTEPGAIERNNSLQQSMQIPFPYSLMKQQAKCQQQDGCNAQQQINPRVLIPQSKKDNNILPQHQRPHRLLYHHKKITNPQQQQQEHLREKQSSSHHASVTKQVPKEINTRLNHVNIEPQKQEASQPKQNNYN